MLGQRASLLFLNLAHAYDHFFLLIFPTAVIGLQGAWGGSYGDLLALGTAAFAVFGLATLPAGWLGDRWSRRHMMTAFFFGTGAAAILAGLAQGPVSLALALALLGLFAAIYHPVATAMIVQVAAQPGRALGVNGVFGNLGVALAPLATGLLVEAWSWRAAFILPGALAVLTGIAFVLAVDAPDPAGRTTARAARPESSRALQVRVFAVVAVTALCGGLVFHGTTIALPKLFEERLAALASGLGQVGLYAAAAFALASLAQIAVGRLLDRVGARPILLLVAGLQVPCLVLLAHAWGWPAFLVATALMLLVFGEIPVGAWLVGRYAAAAWHSRIYGVQYVLSLGVSALVVPAIALLHGATGGFAALLLLLAAAAALVFAAALLLPSRRRLAAAPPVVATRGAAARS